MTAFRTGHFLCDKRLASAAGIVLSRWRLLTRTPWRVDNVSLSLVGSLTMHNCQWTDMQSTCRAQLDAINEPSKGLFPHFQISVGHICREIKVAAYNNGITVQEMAKSAWKEYRLSLRQYGINDRY